MSPRTAAVEDLRRARPRDRVLRASLWVLGLLALHAWVFGFASGAFSFSETFSRKRLDNLLDFLHDVTPKPLRDVPWDWTVAWDWGADLMADRGWEALGATVAISVAAIVLAGVFGALLAVPAVRTLIRAQPFVASPAEASTARRMAWKCVVVATRGVQVFLRAVPEYVWAYLLIFHVYGITPWPAIVALALHNAGILGRLQAEVLENVEPAAPRALRSLGASRAQITTVALLPTTLPRFLLFFFYRWETCVREATVLGMLGVLSLGSVIDDVGGVRKFDQMLFYVLLGALVVMVGDVISGIARGYVRRAT